MSLPTGGAATRSDHDHAGVLGRLGEGEELFDGIIAAQELQNLMGDLG